MIKQKRKQQYNFKTIGGDDNPDFNIKKSHKQILNYIREKEYIKQFNNKDLGIKLNKFCSYIPISYNYNYNSIDIIATITNKDKLKTTILKYSEDIQKELNKNKSYNGYISLTPDNLNKLLINLNNNNIDCITLKTIILKELPDLDLFFNDGGYKKYYDYLVFDDD
jgi:hypothetical protein